MGAPVLKSVEYLSPWSPLPPGGANVGVTVKVDDDPAESGNVLAGRLRDGSVVLGVAVAANSLGNVVVIPTAPLPATSSCWIDVRWVAWDADPAKIDWTGGAVTTAPVVSSTVSLRTAILDGTTLSAAWDFGAASLTPAGANVTVYVAGQNVGAGQLLGSSGALTLHSPAVGTSTSGVSLYLQAMMPVNQSWNGAFQSPFSIGPTLAETTLPVGAPTITGVTCDAGALRVTWTVPPQPSAAAGLVGFDLLVTDATGATTVFPAGQAGGIAALGQPPSSGWSVAGRIRVGAATGSPGTPVTLPGRPTGLTVATNPATGIATLSWTPNGATGYAVSFSDGRPPVTVSAASYTLPQALSPGAGPRVAVAATSGAVSGPASEPLTVPTAAPAPTAADYDGAQVSAAWTPVADAVGYVATILNGQGAVVASSQRTPATEIAFSQTLSAAGEPYSVVVQAVTAAGTGLPSAPLPVMRTALFLSTQAPSVEPPHLFPSASLSLAPTQITIYLPPLGPTTIAATTVGPFQLQPNTGATVLPYKLVFAANSSVWSFTTTSNGTTAPAPSIRPDVLSDYLGFLSAVEAAGAASWGIAVLQQAIARWMPQTFAETLYYAYGLDLPTGSGQAGSVDLRQGVVLRVGFANYTNVWSGDAKSWLNGFGGGPPTDFDVADGLSGTGDWQLSMDAFVARLAASGAMTVMPPAAVTSSDDTAGVADAADLFFPGFPNPFYRLFFPRKLQSPTSTGSTDTQSNFALVAANSWTSLASSSAGLATGSKLACFRGRAVLRVMIRVRINDVERVVPLGTSVGNILDRYGVRPPATPIQLSGVTLERAVGPGLAVLGAQPTTPVDYGCGAGRRVRLDWGAMTTYGGPVDATNLPLLHGDRIAF
ncbi:MAG: hypothetical protein HQL40_13665 [Alphaproteobacteria bacterium]|nr:hypothetical protein [Alphaproteobacteria bacterium]